MEKSRNTKLFTLIEASKLSLKDEIMQYVPQTPAGKNLKNLFTIMLENVPLKDFWRPIYDPSFARKQTKIAFKQHEEVARCKSYNWWKVAALKYNPRCNSRLGNQWEYISFLAVLLKNMIASGWEESEAWKQICYNSSYIGHYKCSTNPVSPLTYEKTCSREVCGFYDLANVSKILAQADYSTTFWKAGGSFKNVPDVMPLSKLKLMIDFDCDLYDSTGWIILEKNPYQI